MKKPTICFLTDYMTIGGLENVVLEAIDGLHQRYDITVHALFGGIAQDLTDRLNGKAEVISEKRNIRELYLISLPVLGGMYLNRLVKKKYDYLIVLRPWFIMASFSSIASEIIYWSHTDKDVMYADWKRFGFLRKMNRHRLQLGYRRFSAIWVVNDLIKEKIETAFGIHNVAALYNPVNCEKIAALAQAPMTEDVFISTGVNFLTVARMSAEKGHYRLLEAVCGLNGRQNYRLILVGDGPERAALEEYVTTRELQDHVVFLGSKENPYPYIRKADALIMPSFTESFGLAALEAMVLDTPVISTDTVGGRFLTQGGKTGMLVENSADGLRSGLNAFISEPDYGVRYADSAHTWAWKFDKRVFSERILRLLQNTDRRK